MNPLSHLTSEQLPEFSERLARIVMLHPYAFTAIQDKKLALMDLDDEMGQAINAEHEAFNRQRERATLEQLNAKTIRANQAYRGALLEYSTLLYDSVSDLAVSYKDMLDYLQTQEANPAQPPTGWTQRFLKPRLRITDAEYREFKSDLQKQYDVLIEHAHHLNTSQESAALVEEIAMTENRLQQMIYNPHASGVKSDKLRENLIHLDRQFTAIFSSVINEAQELRYDTLFIPQSITHMRDVLQSRFSPVLDQSMQERPDEQYDRRGGRN